MIAVLAAAAITAPPMQALPAWLAGHWIQRKGEAIVEEVWMAPREGMMAGVGRSSRPGREPFVEFMTLRRTPVGLVFTAVLQGQAPTGFFRQSRAVPLRSYSRTLHTTFPNASPTAPAGAISARGSKEKRADGRSERTGAIDGSGSFEFRQPGIQAFANPGPLIGQDREGHGVADAAGPGDAILPRNSLLRRAQLQDRRA